MKQVTLQFPDLHLLWQFAQTLTNHTIEIHTETKTLTCTCLEYDVFRATSKFKAMII